MEAVGYTIRKGSPTFWATLLVVLVIVFYKLERVRLTAGFVESVKRFMEFVFLTRQHGAPSDEKEEQSCSMACTIDDARL